MKIPPYQLVFSDPFIEDFKEIAKYIIDSNIDAGSSEEFAEDKSTEFELEVSDLTDDLTLFPDKGTPDKDSGVRRTPVYGGRYSVRWVVNHSAREVSLLHIMDQERPKELRYKETTSGE